MGIVRCPRGEVAVTLAPRMSREGGRVHRGVGLGDAAADGRDVADADGGDAPIRLGEEGRVRLHDVGRLHLSLGYESADAEDAVGRLDAVEPGDAVQADDVVGGDEGLLQQGGEGRAAAHQLGVAVVLCEEFEGLVEGGGSVECEVVHGYFASAAAWMDSMIW